MTKAIETIKESLEILIQARVELVKACRDDLEEEVSKAEQKLYTVLDMLNPPTKDA